MIYWTYINELQHHHQNCNIWGFLPNLVHCYMKSISSLWPTNSCYSNPAVALMACCTKRNENHFLHDIYYYS